jgi:hypothetical protein
MFETFDIIQAPTAGQIDAQIRKAMKLGRRDEIRVGKDTLLDLNIVWKGTRDLSDLALEDAAYLVYGAKWLAKQIRERTIAGRLPTGRRTAKLSPRYLKYKLSQGGRPMRDGIVTGSMWRGFGVRRVKGKTDAIIGFTGTHKPSGTTPGTIKSGVNKGKPINRKVSNQKVANSWALRGRKGVPYSLSSFNGRPAHVFTEADDIQKEQLWREYEMRVLHKGIDELPPIRGMGERVIGRGQKRRWQAISPRSD